MPERSISPPLRIRPTLTRRGVMLAMGGLGLTGVAAFYPVKAAPLPAVVATSTILADLTAVVGRERIQLVSILKPGNDPHIYEPTPADSRALEKAELILYNGYNLEPGLIKLMNSAGVKARKVAVGEVVPPLQLKKEGQSVPDPHVWGDVSQVVTMVGAIQQALSALDPAQKAFFATQAKPLQAQLLNLHTWIRAQIQTIPTPHRKLITTHDAFQYYARAYGIPVLGTLIGISTEEQPSARTVQQLIEAVKASGVPAIFAETTLNPALIQTVAEEAGVKLAPQPLFSDSIGSATSPGPTYLKMMEANTRTIVEALGGSYTPWEGAG